VKALKVFQILDLLKFMGREKLQALLTQANVGECCQFPFDCSESFFLLSQHQPLQKYSSFMVVIQELRLVLKID